MAIHLLIRFWVQNQFLSKKKKSNCITILKLYFKVQSVFWHMKTHTHTPIHKQKHSSKIVDFTHKLHFKLFKEKERWWQIIFFLPILCMMSYVVDYFHLKFSNSNKFKQYIKNEYFSGFHLFSFLLGENLLQVNFDLHFLIGTYFELLQL